MSRTAAQETPERDPGLQPERTRLAWRRTTLSSTAAAVLAMKTTLHGGATAPRIIVGALCCVLWLAFLLVAHRRISVLAATSSPAALSGRHATAGALLTVGLAVSAAALIF